MKNFLTFIVSLLGECIVLPIYGFVISTLWAWFIVPTFALPALSIPVGIGLCLIMLALQGCDPEHMGDEAVSLSDACIHLGMRIVLALCLLCFGFVVVTF